MDSDGWRGIDFDRSTWRDKRMFLDGNDSDELDWELSRQKRYGSS